MSHHYQFKPAPELCPTFKSNRQFLPLGENGRLCASLISLHKSYYMQLEGGKNNHCYDSESGAIERPADSTPRQQLEESQSKTKVDSLESSCR